MRVFHVTPKANLDSILKDGLMPQVGDRASEMSEAKPAVYCFSGAAECENGLTNWLGEQFDEDEALLILELDITDLTVECGPEWEVRVLQTIEPGRFIHLMSEDCFAQSLIKARAAPSPLSR